MAKTRLNKTHRNFLKKFLNENIECKKEQKKRDVAYLKAAMGVRTTLLKRFPLEDMKILEKYRCSARRLLISGGCPKGRLLSFTFDAIDDRVPLVPKVMHSISGVTFSPKVVNYIDNFSFEDDRLRDSISRKKSIYLGLINGAKYFEEVIDAWPASSVLSEIIKSKSTALTILSAENLRMISEDNAGKDVV